MVSRIIHGARTAVLLLMTGLMVQGFFGPTAGAQEQGTKPTKQQPKVGETETLLRGDHILGLQVWDQHRQMLGRVSDIVVDKDVEKVSYVVVSPGRKASKAAENVAVPIQALKKRIGEDYLTLNVTKEQFKKAPRFEADHWPASADMHFWSQAGALPQGSKAGEKAAMPSKGGPPAFALAQITGDKVKDQQGKEIGKITDVYVDTHDGRLVYGLLSFEDVDGLKNKLAVVPWSVIKVMPDQRTASLDASLTTLQGVAFYERNFPRLDSRYLSEISQHFNTKPYWEVYGYPPPQAAPPAMQQRETKEEEGWKKTK